MIAFVLVEWKVAQLPTMPSEFSSSQSSTSTYEYSIYLRLCLVPPWLTREFTHSPPLQEPRRLRDPASELPFRLRLLQHPVLHPYRTPERTRSESHGIRGNYCLHGRRSEHHLRGIGPIHFQTRSIRRSPLVRVRRLDHRRCTVLYIHSVATHLGHGYLPGRRGCGGRLLFPAK